MAADDERDQRPPAVGPASLIYRQFSSENIHVVTNKFVTTWRVFIVSGRRLRHERLLRESTTKKRRTRRKNRRNRLRTAHYSLPTFIASGRHLRHERLLIRPNFVKALIFARLVLTMSRKICTLPAALWFNNYYLLATPHNQEKMMQPVLIGVAETSYRLIRALKPSLPFAGLAVIFIGGLELAQLAFGLEKLKSLAGPGRCRNLR